MPFGGPCRLRVVDELPSQDDRGGFQAGLAESRRDQCTCTTCDRCQRKRPSYMPVSRAGGPGPLSGVQDQESLPGRRRSCDFPNQLVRSTAIFVAVKVPEDTSNRPEAVTAITAVWPPSKSLESCVTKSENVLKLSFRMPVA